MADLRAINVKRPARTSATDNGIWSYREEPIFCPEDTRVVPGPGRTPDDPAHKWSARSPTRGWTSVRRGH